MTKAELLHSLAFLEDDTEVIVWNQGGGELEIERVVYQASAGLRDAFVYIVARASEETLTAPMEKDRG